MNKRWINTAATSFVAIFGISCAVLSGFDIKRWIFMGGSFGIAVTGTAFHLMYMQIAKRRFQSFFGLADNSTMNIAIGSYWNINKYDESLGEEKNYRYYKYDGDSQTVRYLVGAVKYPLTDIGVAAEAIQLTSYINRTGEHKVNLFGDENIHEAVEGTVICLGSPTSNSTTKSLFERLPSEFKLAFTTKTLSCWLHDKEYKSSATLDYGVLMRYTIGNRIYFVCAGIDEHGSIALSKVLLSDWRKLPFVDFVHIYKISKEYSTVIDKLGGKHMTRTGKWISD